MAARSSISYRSKRQRKHPPIVWIGGDKGGIGKSFIARIIASWLRRNGYIVVGVDADARNAHLDRFAGGMPVTRTSLRSEAGWGVLFNTFEKASEESVILVDLAGNVGDAIEREMVRIKRIADALDRDIVHIWVCDQEEDSITLLGRVSSFADAALTLVVLNGRFAPNISSFELWAESELRARLLVEGAHEIYVPALPIRARTKIARARVPFDDLAAAELQIWEQVDFDMWWEGVATALSILHEILEKQS